MGALAIVGALTAPAAVARAATSGYTPNPNEWYFAKWGIQQKVWPVTEGSGITVALVDSGVQASLPDLQGVVKPGTDLAGEPGGGQTDYGPDGGHGTEMAEVIAGQGIGGGSLGNDPVGLAPQAKILPVDVLGSGSASASATAQGIEYAANHGASVINLSLGAPTASSTTCDPTEQQAISFALSKNVVVIAGSGDDNKSGPAPEDPGTCAGVLTVGGVEPSGALWQYSTQGSQVSVSAPGDQIYATSANGKQYTTGGNGTSYSSALVSGAAALVRAAHPAMPWYTVDQRLINTAVAVGKVPNNGTGYGIINIDKAVKTSLYPVSASAPNPPYQRYQAWLKANGQSVASGGGSSGKGGSSSSGQSRGGSDWVVTALEVAGVVLVLVIILIVVLVVRGNRSRRGPRYPGGPGGPGGSYPPNAPSPSPYPANAYPPSGGQYPAPGGQYPQPGQYPPAPQYPSPQSPVSPPGRQYPPPGPQYPPPRP